jgi:pyrroline-5-carboxylate reductase
LYRVGLIGTGNMGQAMLGAWTDSGTLEPSQIIVTDKDPQKAASASGSFSVETGTLAEVGGQSDVVILAVKPQDSDEVLAGLSGVMSGTQVLLSIAAGLTIGSIREKVGGEPTVVRVMPNMAARVRAAVSDFAVDPGSGEFDIAIVRGLLEAIGEAEEVDEKWMDLVTAVSGSGPAYFFYLTEALEGAAIRQGMPEAVARKLARETLWGAAKTIKETGAEPADLRKAVSSPGGTTLAALSEMDSAGFVDIIGKAVEAAMRRAGELAR